MTHRRSKLTVPDLKDIISLFKNNSSASEIAIALGISKISAYRWIEKLSTIQFDSERVGELIKKRGPKYKINTDRELAIANILSTDCSLTQKGIISKLNENDFRISQPTCSLVLKKMNLTKKRLILISDKKNDPETIEKRHFFAVKYRRYSDENILYLDETGFDCIANVRTDIVLKMCLQDLS
ncbi:hypothetical protein DMUE_4392 [Dictyocoela muelleri]|nr:hypothetical protein DMUE_4392 [Dictyocoela muelleri]